MYPSSYLISQGTGLPVVLHKSVYVY